MIEKVKELDVPAAVNVPKVKGHTKIELTSVKTGEKRVIEHDNVFQNAIITKQLRALGSADNNPFADSTWAGRPLWRNLCGGIFLFRDAIDTSNGDVEYMPASNLMVANGSYGITNSGNPPELGSYNSIESSTGGSNSVSFVYDWGTSQGNGTIGCICLTSETGGYIGYGNKSGYTASGITITRNQATVKGEARAFYNGKRFRIVSVDYKNKKVVYEKSNDCITNASLFQNQNWEQHELTYTGTPIGNGNTNSFAKAISPTELLIFKSSTADSIANNTTKGFLIFDAVTETLRIQNITNNTGASLGIIQSAYLEIEKDADGNYYFSAASSGNNNLYRFNSNGVYTASFANIGGSAHSAGMLTPELFASAQNMSSNLNIIFGENDVRPINGTFGNTHQFLYDPTTDTANVFESARVGDTSSGFSTYKNPLYLATVNNLNSAVVKDNTQTMKVTYTLTEA